MSGDVSLSTRPAQAKPSLWARIVDNRDLLALPAMFIIALLIFSLASDKFLTTGNLTNVARQSVYLLIVALG